jgi:hypothetical protein
MSRARNLAGFGSAITSAENAVNIRVGFLTASSYFGDGSELTGTPGGLGTSLLATDLTSPLNKIYYTNANLSIASTITVDPPESASAAYTQYTDIVMQGDADLIIGDGDEFIPDILGIGTFVDMPGVLSGGNSKVRADNYTNKKGTGAAYVPYGLAVPVGTAVSVGYGTEATPGIVGVDTTTGIFFPSAGEIAVTNSGSEKLRVTSTGLGIGTDNPANKLSLRESGFCGIDIQTERQGSGDTIGGLRFLNSAGTSQANIYGKIGNILLFETAGEERLRITGGQVQVSTGSTLQLGDTTASNNVVYNYENVGGGLIQKYYVIDSLNSGQLTRFTFTGTNRKCCMITINAVGSWAASNTASNHVAAQFVSRVFTDSSGNSSDNSTVTTPFAYTYSTGSYAFNNAGSFGYSIDITNPTGDDGVKFSYEIILQNARIDSQHRLTASSTA